MLRWLIHFIELGHIYCLIKHKVFRLLELYIEEFDVMKEAILFLVFGNCPDSRCISMNGTVVQIEPENN